MIIGTIGLFIRYRENWVKTLLINLFWLANVLIVFLWLFAFLVRFMHSGRECSGDFVVSKKEASHLLYVQGMFLRFTSLLILFVAVLITAGHCLNCYQKHTGGTQVGIELEL